MPIDLSPDIREFFKKKLGEAQKAQGVRLSGWTEVYILDLLVRALDTQRIFKAGDHAEIDEPLALILGRAIESADTLEKLRLLRNIGDRSLYVSGFFSDSLSTAAVDIDYYIAMGQGAYRFVAQLTAVKNVKGPQPDVFEEMSQKFEGLVDLLSHVSEGTGLTEDENLLRLYERWLSTKSKHLEERLRNGGILPVEVSKGKVH